MVGLQGVRGVQGVDDTTCTIIIAIINNPQLACSVTAGYCAPPP